MAEESFTIIDNRSGNEVTVPIVDGTISSAALRQLDKGMWFYDPAYLSTANCDSKITFIDGAEGILRYRGYPIEQLADGSSFL
ncbi:MAG: citrate (Si)-synthase, partial [Actinobacteria bacterium]|nr:citrate (Si)-synthase [Actinomycetota bacterium]